MARLWALALALMAGTATAFTAPSARRMPSARRITRMASPITDDVWSMAPPQRVQGDTLKTWDLADERTERVQLSIKSEGRPIEGKIELWQTPSYTPTEFRVYTEDGKLRPVNAVIETPLSPKTVAVFNKANVDFPFDATVVQTGLGKAYDSLSDVESPHLTASTSHSPGGWEANPTTLPSPSSGGFFDDFGKTKEGAVSKRRIAPDGMAYTRREFYRFFGGYSEWERAPPA